MNDDPLSICVPEWAGSGFKDIFEKDSVYLGNLKPGAIAILYTRPGYDEVREYKKVEEGLLYLKGVIQTSNEVDVYYVMLDESKEYASRVHIIGKKFPEGKDVVLSGSTIGGSAIKFNSLMIDGYLNIIDLSKDEPKEIILPNTLGITIVDEKRDTIISMGVEEHKDIKNHALSILGAKSKFINLVYSMKEKDFYDFDVSTLNEWEESVFYRRFDMIRIDEKYLGADTPEKIAHNKSVDDVTKSIEDALKNDPVYKYFKECR